jgi:hypothetical protein
MSGTIGSQDWLKMALLARLAGIDPKASCASWRSKAAARVHRDAGQLRAGGLGRRLRSHCCTPGGKVRVLAVLSEHRLPGVLSSVPTAREQGYDVVWPLIRGVWMGPNVPTPTTGAGSRLRPDGHARLRAAARRGRAVSVLADRRRPDPLRIKQAVARLQPRRPANSTWCADIKPTKETRHDIHQTLIAVAAPAAFRRPSALAQVPAGYPADYQQLVDGAKKEGKLVIYGATDSKADAAADQGFQCPVPGHHGRVQRHELDRGVQPLHFRSGGRRRYRRRDCGPRRWTCR